MIKSHTSAPKIIRDAVREDTKVESDCPYWLWAEPAFESRSKPVEDAAADDEAVIEAEDVNVDDISNSAEVMLMKISDEERDGSGLEREKRPCEDIILSEDPTPRLSHILAPLDTTSLC